MNIKKEVAELYNEMIDLRRDFHKHPELGLNEHRTAGIVEDYLKNLGYETRRCTETGVIGVLKGDKPGKTIMLRCDIDALPVTEETGLPFSSENKGVMHACGHDGHAALHLVTAKLIANHKKDISGTVVFLFQTNEEDAGAELMINAGALENPKPDNVFGFHLWSPIPTGKIGLVTGPIMASSYYFKITISGKGGHGGAPHKAINPIMAAGQVLNAIQAMNIAEFDATKPTAISVGMIHAGNKEIIIPETAEIQGSIRCLHTEDAAIRERFAEVCKSVCKTFQCGCEVEFKCGNTLINNDAQMAKLVEKVADRVIGRENIVSENVSVMLGDDFAEFSNRIPGVYYFIGTRSEEANSTYEHHNPHFTIDEKSLAIGLELQAEIIFEYLK